MIIVDFGQMDADALRAALDRIDAQQEDAHGMMLWHHYEEVSVDEIPGGARLVLIDPDEWQPVLDTYVDAILADTGGDARMVMLNGDPSEGVLRPVSEFAYRGDAERRQRWTEIHHTALGITHLLDQFSPGQIAALADDSATLARTWRQALLWVGIDRREEDIVAIATKSGADALAPDFMGTPPLERLTQQIASAKHRPGF